MKTRSIILLAVFGALLLEQLPLDPALWTSGERSCCALAKACPMSARSGAGAACDKDEDASSCSMRAPCDSPDSGPDGAFWNSALTRPALLADSVWAQALVPQDEVLAAAHSLTSASGKGPPTPPPRWLRS